MIKIISGTINSGKSSFMRNTYATQTNADGFICTKVYADNLHIGYDLERLSNGHKTPFIRKADHRPANWNEAARIGKMYSFCTEGFVFAEMIVNEALSNKIECFFIDEIGPLELTGKGFSRLLNTLLEQNIDLVMAVRESILQEVIQYFHISDPVIVQPSF